MSARECAKECQSSSDLACMTSHVNIVLTVIPNSASDSPDKASVLVPTPSDDTENIKALRTNLSSETSPCCLSVPMTPPVSRAPRTPPRMTARMTSGSSPICSSDEASTIRRVPTSPWTPQVSSEMVNPDECCGDGILVLGLQGVTSQSTSAADSRSNAAVVSDDDREAPAKRARGMHE